MNRFTKRVVRGALLTAAVALVAPAAQALQPSAVTTIDPGLQAQLASGVPSVDVIVQFASKPTEADAALLRKAGFTGAFLRFEVVPAIAAVGSPAAVKAIARNPRVTYIEHDAVLPYSLDRARQATRTGPVWDATYKVGGQLHANGITGRGIGVAIVDSGIDARHPDLRHKQLADATGTRAKTVRNYKVVGRDSVGIVGTFVDLDPVAVDVLNSDNTGGHGTHVAGIAAGTGEASGGKYTGAAPGADLWGFGAGETLVVHEGLAAFDWIHRHKGEHNIRVVNNSWGGAGDWNPQSAVTKAARTLVNEDGIVVVFAAGNDGGDGSTIKTSVWANIPEVISVANYYDRSGWLDSSSSRGKKDLERTWPHLAAPGTQVISAAAAGGPVTYFGTGQDAAVNYLSEYGEPTVVSAPTGGAASHDVAGNEVIVGDYASFTGTSMAAPFVAGVAALILEANPTLTPLEVRDILRATATLPVGRSYAVDGYAIGKGVVDGAEAVAVALRMRDGDTLTEAVANASLNLTASPAQINTTAGPVTDQTIPLAPVVIIRQVEGTPLMFQANAFSVGANTFVRGEPIGLETGELRSNDPAITLNAGNYTGRFEMVHDGVTVYTVPGVPMQHSSRGLIVDGSWQAPLDMETGRWTMRGIVTIAGVDYNAAELPFSIA